jgi:hypothetical protein
VPKTIWSHDSIPLVPPRFRSLYTRLLPAIDFGVVIFGLAALALGSRIVGDFTIPIFLPLWAIMIAVGAFVSLLGLIVLHARLELAGITAATLGLVVYAGLTVLYIMAGSVTSILTLILVVVRIMFYLWRFVDLLGVVQREEAKKAVDTGSLDLATKEPPRE